MSAKLAVVTNVDALIADVSTRVPQPVDTLEIAAVLESMGVTDAVAAEDYGAQSSFELAERIFEPVRDRREPADDTPLVRRQPPLLDFELPPGRLAASARTLVSFVPLTLVVVATQALAAAGWSAGSILAVSFGVTTAMLLTMGPMVAMGRRASLLLGFGYRGAAHGYLTRASLVTYASCVLVAVLVAGAARELGYFRPEERWIFAGSLAGFALFWLLAVGLTLLGVSGLILGTLALGLGVGLVVASEDGGTVGVLAGYGAIVLGLACVWAHGYPRRCVTRRQPPRGASAVEITPYIVAGTLFAVFVGVPHPLGWFGGGGGDTVHQLVTFELSLLLALVPLLLATSVGDIILRAFWEVAADLRDKRSEDGFRRGVSRYVLGGLVRYVVVLGSLTAATIACVEVALRAGRLDDLSRPVFWFGLAAFGLVGVGQYSSTFMLGLALPGHVLAPLLTAVVVLAGVGVPLSRSDYRLAAAAFAAAALAFAIVATAACIQVLRESPRRYSTAF
jgi:hypothetical protein